MEWSCCSILYLRKDGEELKRIKERTERIFMFVATVIIQTDLMRTMFRVLLKESMNCKEIGTVLLCFAIIHAVYLIAWRILRGKKC